MNLPFLRFFKKRKAAEAVVAVAPPPIPPLEKPASERFGKTVMPNVSRVVGLESSGFAAEARVAAPPSYPPAPASRKILLGQNGFGVGPKSSAERASAAAGERMIALQLAELGPHLPAGLLQTTAIDPEQRVFLKASELERGMASGRPTVKLRSIYQQAPDFFTAEVAETDEREVTLPFARVLEQFTAFQVRHDQVAGEAVPQVETPFLQVTLEDSERFGGKAAPIPAPFPLAPSAPPVPAAMPAAPTAIPAAPPPAPRPIRLPLPNEKNVAGPLPSAPIRLDSAPARQPLAAKTISPNGTGVPATERVPASSGPPVPTPPVTPVAPPQPIRIPFKVSPPSNDLRVPVSSVSSPPARKVSTIFSAVGPRVRLPLGIVLRGISPFQLSGPIDAVPATAMIEIPFSIIEPQLSLGRIAISPAQFQAALPEEFRSLLKTEEADLPIALPLEEVLQNLPDESLELRGDQEEAEIADAFETPFSKKAAEDAARLKSAAGPIARSALATKAADSASEQPASLLPESAIPATARTALQVALDTDEALDAKAIVAHASRLPGVSACAIVFSDGLSLAGNIPAEFEAEALCALAPSIVKRIDDQMLGAKLGPLTGITLFCAKTPVSFFAHGNICLAALHSAGEIAAEIRARLGCAAREIARMYTQPA